MTGSLSQTRGRPAVSAPTMHKSALLRRIQPRALRPRIGENLRDAELRWQARNDPRIADAVRGGCSKADIATRVGVSKTAILGALRRAAKAGAQ